MMDMLRLPIHTHENEIVPVSTRVVAWYHVIHHQGWYRRLSPSIQGDLKIFRECHPLLRIPHADKVRNEVEKTTSVIISLE